MSYFAKPNFIIYDEWFDDFKKTKVDYKNKEIKTFSNMHEFFYAQSNYKCGASENNFQLDIKVNEKKIFTNNNLEKNSKKYTSVSSKKQIKITKKFIYYFSIFGFLFIFGFLLFISQPKKNESNITNTSFVLEKEV